MAGVRVGEDAMLGAMSLATKEIGDHSIAGGVPAKQLKTKDQATQFKDRSDVPAPKHEQPECD
jgi:acetyltransferase-like isoleucine patch superfamily enzyme